MHAIDMLNEKDMGSEKKASTEIDVNSHDESVNKFFKDAAKCQPNQLDNYVLQPSRDSARIEIINRRKFFLITNIIS